LLFLDAQGLNAWLYYAQRVCYGWQAHLIGSWLAGLVLTVPPLILADALEDKGHDNIAHFLRFHFSHDEITHPNLAIQLPLPWPVPPPASWPGYLAV